MVECVCVCLCACMLVCVLSSLSTKWPSPLHLENPVGLPLSPLTASISTSDISAPPCLPVHSSVLSYLLLLPEKAAATTSTDREPPA